MFSGAASSLSGPRGGVVGIGVGGAGLISISVHIRFDLSHCCCLAVLVCDGGQDDNGEGQGRLHDVLVEALMKGSWNDLNLK